MSKQYEVTLPSGRVVKCVPVSAFNFADIYSDDGEAPVTVRLICACTVDPKMAPYQSGDKRIPKGLKSLEDELPGLADQMFLAGQIAERSGVTEAMESINGLEGNESLTESPEDATSVD